MKNKSKIDKYESLTSLKWLPKSGEIKLKPFAKGKEITVLRRGVFVTDTQGSLLIRKPEDLQAFSNLLNHAWQIWVVPELEKRKKAKLKPPFPLGALCVLFDTGKGKPHTIKFNDEIKLIAYIRVKKAMKINKDQEITFDDVMDFGSVEPPMKDGKPIGFFMVRFKGNQISVYFDFRPNDPEFNINDWGDEPIWLANACLETILAEQFGHLALIIPELSKIDIPFTIGLKAQKMKTLCNIVEQGIEEREIDKKLSRLVTRKDVKELVDNWIKTNIFSKRAHILKEVEKGYNNGIYGALILLLMSQVEGVITEELILNDLGIRKNGQAKYWDIRINEFYDIIKKKEIGPMTLRILDGVYYFLKNSNLYSKFSWNSDKDDYVNRHAAIHGKDNKFNTRANAIRMILLFDALYWIFMAISISEKDKK